MCGIIGLYGAFNKNILNKSLDLIDHRGPDNRDIYVNNNDNIYLGHSRLSIIDLSFSANQPMIDDSGLVIVYNGEIYNYKDLRIGLIKKGFVFKSNSDTEVLLKLYIYEEEKMLSRLNGIFSFAIWDGRKKKLLIARDALGVKPLYYSSTEEGFTFSSEIKAIINIFPSNLVLDYQSLQQYLTFIWSPGDRTPVQTINKVLPGEAMWISDNKIERKWSWYKLPVRSGKSIISSKTEIISGVTTHLRNAVNSQMLSDVPVGAFLSGGLDSSTIVAFARDNNPGIPCFTIETSGGQEEGMVDDLPYARKVAKHLNVPLHVINIDADKMATGLENMVAMLDEPLADPAPLNVLYISQLAKENGIKVLLSGVGGDDIFTGYRRHYAIQLDRYLQKIPFKIKTSIERYTSSLNKTNPFYRRVAKLFNGSTLDGDKRIVNYFRWADVDLINSLFTSDVRKELAVESADRTMMNYLDMLPKSASPLQRMLALEQRFFLPDHNLTYADKMSMAVGVEVRVPFLDLDLVEFASKIPDKYKQRGSVGKWILKKSMEPYLPHDIIYRPKTGFGAPLRRWIRFELRELLGDLLSEESLRKRSVFESKAVHQLIKKNDSGVVDASYTLLSLMCIEIWCRQFVDGKFDYKKVYGNLNNG
jgi:asparagine synthase (glutamine-hydrolysing)